MVRLAANINWLWKELPLEQRLLAAGRAGFRAVESLDPYVATIEDWKRWLDASRLTLVLINAPSGSSAHQPVRGLAAWPGKEDEFQAAFSQAVEYAIALRVPFIHATAGPKGIGGAEDVQQACYEKNLIWACDTASRHGVGVTIEPLSPRDASNAFMSSLPHALKTLQAVDRKNLKLQFDLYHQQVLHGDIVMNLRAYIGRIGHIQVAGVPDRTEPHFGELSFSRIAEELGQLGYAGFVGCEYRPVTSPEEGLYWAQPYLRS